MPIICYACENGHYTKKFVRKPKDAPVTFPCPACEKPVERKLSAPSTASIVIVDNGVQAKAVEVNLDMVEKIREQSTKDFTTKE